MLWIGRVYASLSLHLYGKAVVNKVLVVVMKNETLAAAMEMKKEVLAAMVAVQRKKRQWVW